MNTMNKHTHMCVRFRWGIENKIFRIGPEYNFRKEGKEDHQSVKIRNIIHGN